MGPLLLLIHCLGLFGFLHQQSPTCTLLFSCQHSLALVLSVWCWCAWWGAAAGFSLQMMFDGLKQTIDMYRKAVQAEEMAIADPILHQKFKQVGQIAFRQPA